MSNIFQSLKQEVHKAYTSTVNSLTPALRDSKFLQEGVLTPEEFVAAGDLLVYKCPTWAWSAGERQRAVAYLPADKQFLITRAVPCVERYERKNDNSGDVVVEDDWLATPDDAEDANSNIRDLVDAGSPVVHETAGANDDEEDYSELLDMEALPEDQSLIVADAASAANNGTKGEESNVLRQRTYDISMTYDKYYQTPRVWLFGYDEQRQPLTPTQIFSDISADHANKTVTLDQHPHLGVPFAYIHPCRHAAVMKKFVARMVDQGKVPRVDQYLLLFLKFLSAVMPTIQYDNTFEIGL